MFYQEGAVPGLPTHQSGCAAASSAVASCLSPASQPPRLLQLPVPAVGVCKSDVPRTPLGGARQPWSNCASWGLQLEPREGRKGLKMSSSDAHRTSREGSAKRCDSFAEAPACGWGVGQVWGRPASAVLRQRFSPRSSRSALRSGSGDCGEARGEDVWYPVSGKQLSRGRV